MRLRFLAALAAMSLSFDPTLAAQAQTRPAPIVTVSGEATVEVTPDLAVISTGVTSQGRTAREAAEANAKAVAPLLGALKDAGIDDPDIQTSQLSIQPLRDPNRSTVGRVTGFQASNEVTVKIRDISKVSDVIDRLLGAGANSLSGIEFLVADPSAALDRARSQGMDDAKHKAEIYARAAGAGLGRPVAISEETPAPRFLRSAVAAASAASTPVAVGQSTLRISVSVTFELMY
jgi:uncharacterized protein YggE